MYKSIELKNFESRSYRTVLAKSFLLAHLIWNMCVLL